MDLQALSTLLSLLLFATTTLACAGYGRCRCYDTKTNTLNFTLTKSVCSGTRSRAYFVDNDGCHAPDWDIDFSNCDWRVACNRQYGETDPNSHHFVDYCDDKKNMDHMKSLHDYQLWDDAVDVDINHSGHGHWDNGVWVKDP